MTLQAVITGLASVEALIAGLSTGQCFDETPDTIETSLPVCINVTARGTIARSAGEGWRETRHTILAQLLCAEPGTDLPTAETIARPYVSKFITKLDTNRSLAGSCLDAEVTGYEYGEIKLNPASPGYLGVVFSIDATEHETGMLFASTST
ncbi:MAG: hypothetical protein NUW01_05720 [Gemmatimonadaceae bacterium]|nr:hypothetical protein [Gemmatimonadaceae bacterium]